MIHAELRSLTSTDVPNDLSTFLPKNPAVFHLVVSAVVGASDDPRGGDLFSFHVCTGEWLVENPPPKGFEFMRHYLRLERWDYDVLVRAISDLCLRTEGEDWPEVATRLGRFGAWEFEDYRDV